MKPLVTSRIEEGTKQKLVEVAASERRSLSLMIEILLEEALTAREQKQNGRVLQ